MILPKLYPIDKKAQETMSNFISHEEMQIKTMTRYHYTKKSFKKY